jgi:general secretion pathway protein L
MAHRILGIELGSYSVKVAVASAGFRSASIVQTLERRVPPGDGPVEERAAAALAELFREHQLQHDVPYVALPGEAASLRILDFEFSGLKRADLEKAIGTELEGQLPHDLDELVYDFDVIPRDVAQPAVDAGDPAFVAAGAVPSTSTPTATSPVPVKTGTRVLTAATTKERVSAFLGILSARGVDPRGVIAAPAAYARVAEKLAALGAPPARDEAVLVLDHGHNRTNAAVILRGRTIYARALSRGGRHITQAIARAWNLPFEEAEAAKHSDGIIISERFPAPSNSDAWQRISQVIRAELTPLVRDLRQTLAACRAQTGAQVVRGVLCGGGSRLRGLVPFLSDELGVPLGTVTPDDQMRLLAPAGARAGVDPDLAVLSTGIALEGATGRPAFDLRRGTLAYKADYSFLRAKAGYLAACVLVVVAFAAATAYASLYRLRKEQAILDDRLRETTTEMFGQPATVEEVEEKVTPTKEQSPLPKMTAYDQLVEISKRLPPRNEVKLDVMELEIEPKKITMKTIAESSAAIDAIEKKLKEVDCFTGFSRGDQSTVAEGKQLTLTIPNKCM